MILIIDDKEIEIKDASSFTKRLFGLMGKKNINYGMLFKKCNAVHTFFMKENIDILGIDENNSVIYKSINTPKNKIIKIKKKLKKTSVLELPKNTSKNIKINDKLLFKSKHVI